MLRCHGESVPGKAFLHDLFIVLVEALPAFVCGAVCVCFSGVCVSVRQAAVL